MPRNEIAPKGSRLVVLAASCVVVAALWFMQDVLIPVALAVLITFLLTPIVSRLERWKLGRIGAVLVVTLGLFAAIGGLGYIVTGQVLNLARNLDRYAGNITEKIQRGPPRQGGRD
jgi:predicted PurR-regulated permease PerM